MSDISLCVFDLLPHGSVKVTMLCHSNIVHFLCKCAFVKGTFAFAKNWIKFSPLTGETTIEFIVSVVEGTCNRNH